MTDDYIPERAAPDTVTASPSATHDSGIATDVEPEPTKQQWWTLSRRRTLYWAAMVAMIVAGIQQGWITTEATGAWLDALAASGPGLAALAGGIGSLILALRNPTPDN